MRKEKQLYKEGETVSITLDKKLANQLNALEDTGLIEDVNIEGFIFSSSKHDNLLKLTGNRDLVKRNINKKKELLKEKGFKTVTPAILDTKGHIIDGQHRIFAATELNIPFNFVIDTEANNSIEEAILLNNSSFNWNIEDYFNAYSEKNNQNYIKLLKLKEELELNMTRTLLLYLKGDYGSSEQSCMKNGQFLYNEKKATEARTIYKEYKELESLVLNPTFLKIIKSESFLRAYLFIRKKPDFKFKQLKEQFKNVHYVLLNPKDIKHSLIEVYNYKRKSNRIKI